LTVAPAATTNPPTTTGASTTASLSWTPSTTTGVAGYRVYVGTAPGVYGSPVNVGNVTSYTVANLAVGYTYYFVVTDYDAGGTESPPSNEVSKIIY
jgi:fibronectin type 3 domain-containing protein